MIDSIPKLEVHSATKLRHMEDCSPALPRTSESFRRRKQKVCAHQKRKTRCRICGGGSICPHGRRKDSCRTCIEGARGISKQALLASQQQPTEGGEGGHVIQDEISTHPGRGVTCSEEDGTDWSDVLSGCMVISVVSSSRLTEEDAYGKLVPVAHPIESQRPRDDQLSLEGCDSFTFRRDFLKAKSLCFDELMVPGWPPTTSRQSAEW